jgi:cyanophycin synthetase
LGDNIFEIRCGQRTIRTCLNYSPLDDSVTLRLAGRKQLVYKLLAEAGMPVPNHLAIKGTDWNTAKRFLETANKPIVVKPSFGTGAGAGVTTNITTAAQLMRAMAWSNAFCPETIVEEQIAGDNYRLLYLDGKLIDCVIRRAPTLTGDGISSIRALIGLENALRVKTGMTVAQAALNADLDMKNTLALSGMSLSTVPGKGEVVCVKNVINSNRADDNEAATALVCKSVVDLGQQVIDRLGIRLAGVDIITPDASIGLAESGGAIVDVNTTPGFYYHYLKKGGEFPAAIEVLRTALDKRDVSTHAAE